LQGYFGEKNVKESNLTHIGSMNYEGPNVSFQNLDDAVNENVVIV